VAAPNPVRGRLVLSVLCDGPADEAVLRVYAPSLACVRELALPGPTAAGWARLEAGLEGLAPGLYHCRVQLRRGQAWSPPARATFYLLEAR